MKKHSLKFAAILFVLALFGLASCIKAQGVTNVPPALQSSIANAPNAKLEGAVIRPIQKAKVEPEKTGWTYEDEKGRSYPVFRSEAGKLFYFKTSANTGKEYKVYITLAQ